MLLQIFAAWPAPASPAWITALPICSRKGLARSKPSSDPPTMKVSVPPSAAAIPPETGASTIVKPARLRLGFDRLGGGDVDRRAVDQDRRLGGVDEDIVAIDLGDMLARGKHGDDGFGMRDRGLGAVGDRAAIGLGAGERVRAEVEGHDLMPRLGEVGGHPAAHVAKPDECYACHVVILTCRSSCPGACRRRRPCLPSGRRCRTGRGTSGVRS